MRRLLLLVGLVAVLAVSLVALLVLASPSGEVVTDETGTNTLELAMLAVPVAEAEPFIEAPDQFLGVMHAPPAFDTDDFGPDLTLRQDVSSLGPLDPQEVLRAVYLGHDVDGDPYYIWHNGSRDLRQLIGQILADFGSVGRLESSYGTESGGDGLLERGLEESLPETGLVAGGVTQGSFEPTLLVAEWHGLPSVIAAVVFYEDGKPIGWQVPVSGTAALQRTYDDATVGGFNHLIEVSALTADGDEWNRLTVFG